jgi:hypothetical protein
MWKRIRRRTMAPSRPAVHPEQLGLLLITLIVIAGGLWAVFRIL